MPAEASKSPADRNTQFIKDASKGRLKAVRKWTDEGMPVIWRGNGNTTALIAASEYGHADVVRELIGAGARLNETTTGRWTALTLAATRGHFEVVKVLLEGGADPNMETKLGDTALSLAMKNGHRRVSVFLEERGARLAELIRRGADVNARAGLGPTPLLLATTNGNLQLMRMLLDGKADVNLTGTIEIGPRPTPTVEVESLEDSRIFTRTTHSPRAPEPLDVPPLIVAVRRGWLDAVKLLLDFGAETERTDKEGLTALAWAKKLGDQNIEKLLAQSGANTAADVHGSAENALLIAAASGDLARVRALLSAGANANAHVDSVEGRKTPLSEAAKAGYSEIIRVLIAAGAEADKPVGERLGTMGQTPLMIAAERQHVAAVNALLEAKADVTATDTVVFGGGRETPLHYAARGGSREVTEILIKAGAKISARSKSGNTALKIALGEGHDDIIELLLGAGGRIVTRMGRVSEALQNAAFSDNVAAVKRILKARPNAHGNDAEFACLAAHGVKLKILEALVDGGLPINTIDLEGDTPLMYAVRAGRKNVVQFLLSRGANAKIRSKEKKTAAMLASEFGYRDIARLLQKRR